MKIWLGVGTLIAAAVLPVAARHSGLRLNDSASMPVGFYRVVRSSNTAAICLPEATLRTAASAGLTLRPGDCPDGKEPILKSVYRATPVTPITFTPSGFIVGNQVLANTAAKLHSKTGVPLDHLPYGTYTAGLWAISNYNASSFDSRYFGPVPESSIRYFVKPFFLF